MSVAMQVLDGSYSVFVRKLYVNADNGDWDHTQDFLAFALSHCGFPECFGGQSPRRVARRTCVASREAPFRLAD